MSENMIYDHISGDDVVSDSYNLIPELQALAEQLGIHDWRTIHKAETALARAGQAGLAAVFWGLSHPNAQIRRGSAFFFDHHGTDACFQQLQWVALHDPVAMVRRAAIHSATCQRCKPSPLMSDLVGLLVQVAISDTDRRVREDAIDGLRRQPQDSRVIAALQQILSTEMNPRVRSAAHRALKVQDPSYKARVDAQARERGIAAGRATREQRLLHQVHTRYGIWRG